MAMTWLAIAVAGLGGGVVATLIEDAIRRRRAYRTGLLLVRAELGRNAVWIETAYKPNASAFRDKLLARGQITSRDWEVHRAALAWRLWKKNQPVWAALAAMYDTLEAFSVTGEYPPKEASGELRDLSDRLGKVDPTWLEMSLVFLCSHRLTRLIGVPLARYVTRKERIVLPE
jgi:hypothetical protein